MYRNGEIDQVMETFEKNLKDIPVYVGGKPVRSKKVDITLENGRISSRYVLNQYYEHGTLNALFIAYLWGYSNGKAAGIN
jgi:hypothetical protein